MKVSLNNIEKAYYDAVYRVTKAVLAPVVAGISDTFSETITRAVKQGIHEAVPKFKVSQGVSLSDLASVFFGKK